MTYTLSWKCTRGELRVWANLLRHLGIYDQPIKSYARETKLKIINQHLQQYDGVVVQADTVGVRLEFASQDGYVQFLLSYGASNG